eukprot:TRINITY_DN17324_c0_g1_i10.p1 TRINITY_DN17324_c0_g1~~TRINITY_DN17324_c0_g1_i10.p1  ORF type:complete len:600 (-),score=137.21 TRINITY_DN17324_c0_g1_i10:411-2210(-)
MEMRAAEKKHCATLVQHANVRLQINEVARLNALETATQVKDRSRAFAQELSSTAAFQAVSGSLEVYMKKAAATLTNTASLDELKACKSVLDDALCVAEDVVNSVTDSICRVDEMSKDINAATAASVKLDETSKEVETANVKLHEVEESYLEMEMMVASTQGRLLQVRTRLKWDTHLPLEHSLNIFKMAGEVGRRCLACVCQDFAQVVALGRKNGNFRRAQLVVMCDQIRSSRPVHRIGHTFSILPSEPALEARTHSYVHNCESRSKYAVVQHGNSIYVLGGTMFPPKRDREPGKDQKRSPTVSCCVFRPDRSLRWEPIADMPHPRENFQAVLVQGKIVVFGGDRRSVVPPKSCELYDPETNTWTPTGPLQDDERRSFGLAVNGGNIYQVGGVVKGMFVRTVQRFNLTTRQWYLDPTLVPSMLQRRAFTSCVVFQNRLVAIGGKNREHTLSTCEALNLETHTWAEFGLLHTPRFSTGAAVVSGRLIVCGGRGLNNCYHNSVEEYIPNAGWMLVEPMATPRASLLQMPSGGRHGSHSDKNLVACQFGDSSLLVLGGQEKDQRSVGEIMNLETGEWSKFNHVDGLAGNGFKIYDAMVVTNLM